MKSINKTVSVFAAIAFLVGLMAPFASGLSLAAENPSADYDNAKAQYLSEVNFYKTARQQLLDARSNFQNFKSADNKKAYEDQARAYLKKAIDVLIKRLESMKAWVSGRSALSDTDKQVTIAEIDQDISKLKAIKEGIDTATPEQLKAKAKEIRDYWKNHRVYVKKIIGKVWAARLNALVVKAESFSIKLDAKIQELKAAGKDTTQLETWLADFNQKIATAKQKNELAKAKFQAISNLSEADQFFREGRKYIVDANQYIKEAHVQLVKIVKEMKKMGKTIEAPTPTPTSSPAAYSCPAEKSINCMPTVVPDGTQANPKPECGGDYHEWIKQNCSDVQFTY